MKGWYVTLSSAGKQNWSFLVVGPAHSVGKPEAVVEATMRHVPEHSRAHISHTRAELVGSTVLIEGTCPQCSFPLGLEVKK